MNRNGGLLCSLTMLMLCACNSNTAPGNDREAQLDSAPMPASVVPASQALSGIATEAVQAETMTATEIASLGGAEGRCLIRLTRVGLPSFVLDERHGTGAIKLNNKLIPLQAEPGGHYYSDGDLRVVIRPVDQQLAKEVFREVDMIVMLPGAKDELGYRGYEDCSQAPE
ncbi:DUF6692 family protein [Novosphingobium sp. M1R2S20]|uniref:DUF6692 family protein n=1 Tax=Novosphingobium rhizovicinum TaxID=3228928 RepID=A0ABV3RA02_9SPHN